MSKVVLDAELRAKLDGATETVELTDEAGNVIGRFVPEGRSYVTDAVYDRMMSAILRPSSRAELDEARKEMLEHGGVSTAEILAGLEEIKRQWEARK